VLAVQVAVQIQARFQQQVVLEPLIKVTQVALLEMPQVHLTVAEVVAEQVQSVQIWLLVALVEQVALVFQVLLTEPQQLAQVVVVVPVMVLQVEQVVQVVVERVLQVALLTQELQVQQILAVAEVVFMVVIMHQEQVALAL
jgi:hypothetical protein